MKRRKIDGNGVNGGSVATSEVRDSTSRGIYTSFRAPHTEARPKAVSAPQNLREAIAYFTDDLDVATEFLAAVRWPDGPECPACGCKAHSYIKTRRIWKCKDCRRQYSAKLGTIFEDSPIPLDKWMLALWLIVNCKNGVSSYEIAKDVKVTQKSAWFMLHRIREAMSSRRFGFSKIGSGDAGSGAVEADETFVGGRAEFMHRERRIRLERKNTESNEPNYHNKTIVMGMLDRDLREVDLTDLLYQVEC